MTDIEIWKTAVYDDEIYEGLYKVSNFGKILSLNYKRTGKAELMKPGEDKDGYFQRRRNHRQRKNYYRMGYFKRK